MTSNDENSLEQTRIGAREEDRLGDMMRLALAGNSAVYADLLKEVAKVGNGVKLGDGLGDWNILKSIRHDLKAVNEPVRRCGGWDLAVGVAEFDCV